MNIGVKMNSKCVVCTDPETSNNPIFCCDECGISVHQLCYGISDGCTDRWCCSPCNVGQNIPSCELCLQKDGAFKKTTCGKWVHVICALFTVGVKFQNNILMEPVNILKIPNTNRNKGCMYCSYAIGICCKCSQPNCKSWLHITCAQKANCLKEINEKKNKIAFRAYCSEHRPVDESSRRLSSIFVRERLSEEGRQCQIDESAEEVYSDIANNAKNATDDPENSSDINNSIGLLASFSINDSKDANTVVSENTNEINNDSREASDVISVNEDTKNSSLVSDKIVMNGQVSEKANSSKIEGTTSIHGNINYCGI